MDDVDSAAFRLDQQRCRMVRSVKVTRSTDPDLRHVIGQDDISTNYRRAIWKIRFRNTDLAHSPSLCSIYHYETCIGISPEGNVNPCPAELLQLYFSSFEAGIANAISSLK